MNEVDFEKLQEEFERALADYSSGTGARGLTSYEWSKVWGLSKKIARERIREYVRNGIMQYVGRAPRTNIDGAIRPVQVYAPVSSGTDSISKKIVKSDK